MRMLKKVLLVSLFGMVVSGRSLPVQADSPPGGAKIPGMELASLDELKNSETYLRKDLGLGSGSGDSSTPLWQREIEERPLTVGISALMAVGGIVGFVIIYRRQSRATKDGLKLARENAARYGGGYGGGGGGSPGMPAPIPIQELISKESEQIETVAVLSQEKVPRRVDSVLDSLRYAVGTGAAASRISLVRQEDDARQFRIAGFSKGEDFHVFNPVVTPPEEIFSMPIRALSPFSGSSGGGREATKGWVYPFVSESGELCGLILEMNQGRPPDSWADYVSGSLDLIKALLARQKLAKEDVTLTTQDDSGSLDFRASTNRLLEEWSKATKLGVPFSVVLIRVENNSLLGKLYGTTKMEGVWSRLIEMIKGVLRPSDWVMRPEADLVVVQVLEAGSEEVQVVVRRIVREFRKADTPRTIENPVRYLGVVMTYPIGSGLSVNTFFDQALRRFGEHPDFEGEYYFS